VKPADLFSIELLRYGGVSGVALVVDFALLTLLTVLGIHYLVAATISFLIGGVVAYFLSVRFVFAHHRMRIRSFEAMAFVGLGLAGLAVNTVVIALVVGKMHATVLVGKAAAACCTFGVNFLLRKLILFSPRPERAANVGH
jgi:putative flippase GtrA